MEVDDPFTSSDRESATKSNYITSFRHYDDAKLLFVEVALDGTSIYIYIAEQRDVA